MADSSEAPAAGMLTFKVKSGDKSHSISIAESATVADLKSKLAGEDFENIPAERQRLIYSGRVMKNDDGLGTYKIKPGNTVHLVKSAASNPAPAAPSSSAPTPAAVPQNMASGTAANNIMAGLTGARFAGHANLPNASLFGADGGMGAPPSDEDMASMLENNPAVLSSMTEALNNPDFVDYMIQSNPMLRNMPNAREMLQSPHFRSMMTNPESIRAAARMRRAMGQGRGPSAFPAPGATDTTPAGAPSSDAAAGTNPDQVPNLGAFGGMFPGFGGGGFGGQNDLMGLLGGLGQAAPGSNPASPPPAATSPTPGQGNAAGIPAANPGVGGGDQANPFAALFGGMPGGGAGAGAAGQNPFAAYGMPPPTPEQLQQVMQMLGGMGGAGGGAGAGAGAGTGFPGGFGGFGGFGSPSPAPPADNRPPEERYADQLRQLNDMGFFDFERNIEALRRSGGSVQGAIEHLLS